MGRPSQSSCPVLLMHAPCCFYHQKVLLPVLGGAIEPTTTVVNKAWGYFMSLLTSTLHASFKHMLFPVFFQAANLQALLNVTAWSMEPNFDPQQHDLATFRVYYFLSCLKEHTSCQGCLPVNGLTLIQAMQVGTFVHIWVQGIDVRPGQWDAQFNGSALCPPIKLWAELPGEVSVHDKWLAEPQTMILTGSICLPSYIQKTSWSCQLQGGPRIRQCSKHSPSCQCHS